MWKEFGFDDGYDWTMDTMDGDQRATYPIRSLSILLSWNCAILGSYQYLSRIRTIRDEHLEFHFRSAN